MYLYNASEFRARGTRFSGLSSTSAQSTLPRGDSRLIRTGIGRVHCSSSFDSSSRDRRPIENRGSVRLILIPLCLYSWNAGRYRDREDDDARFVATSLGTSVIFVVSSLRMFDGIEIGRYEDTIFISRDCEDVDLFTRPASRFSTEFGKLRRSRVRFAEV